MSEVSPPHSNLPPQSRGAPISATDANAITRAIQGLLVAGDGIMIRRTGSAITISLNSYRDRIIGGKGGGTDIVNAADKAALDAQTPQAPRLGWTENTQILYVRSEDGLTWDIESRWRKVIL